MAAAIDNYLTEPQLEIDQLIHFYSAPHPISADLASLNPPSSTFHRPPRSIMDSHSGLSVSSVHGSIPEQLLSIPPPLISLLVHVSTPIHALAVFSLLIRWSHPLGPWPSWLLLFAWWAFCFGIATALRWGALNIAFTLILLSGWSKSRSNRHSPTQLSNPSLKSTSPLTPQSVARTLSSFQVIADHFYLLSISLRPLLDLVSWNNFDQSKAILQVTILSWPLFVILLRFVSLNSILAFLGTVVIIWSSPWFRLLRNLLWRSFLVRWTVRILIRLCSGDFRGVVNEIYRGSHHGDVLKLWPTALSIFSLCPSGLQVSIPKESDVSNVRRKELVDSDIPANSQQIEFRFIVFENQRWWMGLDWTSTLLPHERASWTDHLNQPVPSPAEFQLPAPSTYPDPTLGCDRIVDWKWLDPDWHIRQAHPGPSSSEPTRAHGERNKVLGSNRLRHRLKSAISTKPGSDSPSNAASPPQSPDSSGHHRCPEGVQSTDSNQSTGDLNFHIGSQALSEFGIDGAVVAGEDLSSLWDVDSNGWQYGDNHWEKLTRKAGIGRYTRRRAWHRRAVMITAVSPSRDKVEPLAPG